MNSNGHLHRELITVISQLNLETGGFLKIECIG